MIIKFGKNIELSEWNNNSQDDLSVLRSINSFHRIYRMQNNRYVIGVSVRELTWSKLIDNNYQKCYAMFFHDLTFLQEYFPHHIDGDLDFTKNYVDNFLIKMSGLTVFM